MKTLKHKKIFVSLLLGLFAAWQMKGILTPLLLGGKIFDNRSLLIQIGIILILSVLISTILALFYYLFELLLVRHFALTTKVAQMWRDRIMSKAKFRMLLANILNAPLITWALLGFLVPYLLFFIRPVFFSSQTMLFIKYVPTLDPIGYDLKQMLSYSKSWFIAKQTPYIGNNLYPPLASILFTPLLAAGSSLAFKIVTLVNILSYVLITFALPQIISKEKKCRL